MTGLKLVKAFMVGIGVSLITTGTVFAQEAFKTTEAVEETTVDEKMVEKQSEVDKKVFEEYQDELVDKEITITHTAPLEGYVEVGISPYNQKNANYVYELLGKDEIEVVEGDPSLMYTTNVVELGAEVEQEKQENFMIPVIIIAAGVVIVGGSAVFLIKKKAKN